SEFAYRQRDPCPRVRPHLAGAAFAGCLSAHRRRLHPLPRRATFLEPLRESSERTRPVRRHHSGFHRSDILAQHSRASALDNTVLHIRVLASIPTNLPDLTDLTFSPDGSTLVISDRGGTTKSVGHRQRRGT